MEREFIFVNDRLLPAHEAQVSVNDRGFLYGDGFFETMRAEAGRVLFLTEHLARLEASCRQFQIKLPPEIPWTDQIQQLLAQNNLNARLAMVKILVTRGQAVGLGLPASDHPTTVIFARPYEPPEAAEYRQGWPVVTFPESRASFLGRHKSLNYLFCLAARQYALDRGGREALILEPDGTISEGAATGLLFAETGSYFIPQTASGLPSVTVAMVKRALTRRQIPVTAVPTTVERLDQAQGVWLANSLMGLLPVASLDGRDLTRSQQTVFLNQCLWSEAG
ncbi:MAG: aminotransferase class IV [Deltaproteobacteria bacterium]|nr:aminotransferase class IV [Deltaproteobacteria bacterium]MBW1986850.1 aminotransferase class IV [Deltaproteobacteria bacterium]MBW2134974.1 aminotransferase class IV [Deltaproteobacteria bacterium]